jgi:hypothetical protein
LPLVQAAGELRAQQCPRNRSQGADREQRPVDAAGDMADDAGDPHRDADDEVGPDRARRLLSDPPQERGQPERPEDQADEAAEEADRGARGDRGADVRLGSLPRLDGALRA